jgi:anti-sigma factor RsiW
VTGYDGPIEPDDVAHPQVVEIGPYLLGALAPAEREAVRSHLEDCERCRRELVELSAVPALLSAEERWRLGGEPAAPPEPDGARRRVLENLLIRRRRARRRLGVTVGAALTALAAVLATSVVSSATTRGSAPAVAAAFVPTAQAPQLDATLSLRAHQWGTEIDVRAARVAAPGTVVEVVAVNALGQTLDAGTWRVAPGLVTCRTSAWWPRSVVRVVELQAASGVVLATATVPASDGR